MKSSSLREKVVEEVNQIPEEKLAPVLELIHHFRLGLQISKKKAAKATEFAGCWKDMPEEAYRDLIDEITKRRQMAFSGRGNREADIG